MKPSRFPVLGYLLVLGSLSFFFSPPADARASAQKGLWVSVVEEKSVLKDLAKVDDLIAFCARKGFDTLFIQVYRADKAWFPSGVADPAPYRDAIGRTGQDTLKYLIRQAHARSIEVHAWVNTLSIAQNREAFILEKHGEAVLTRDQKDHLPLEDADAGSADPRFELEKQLFLEPGDFRVKEHLEAVISEIAGAYPELDGIHFDYIRYPAVVPFVPGSRFNYVGLSYGYGEYNKRRFEEETGIDPRRVAGQRLEARVWDRWKRDQVTAILRDLVRTAKTTNPELTISCAVVPSIDRFYEGVSQDWPFWIEEGLVDFVVVMNYTDDARRFRLNSEAALALSREPSKVFMGIGAYLLAEDPGEFDRFRRIAESLAAGGVVYFNYTSLSQKPLVDRLQDL